LAGAFILTLIFAAAALFFGDQSNQHALGALNARATAVANADAAQQSKVDADIQRNAALAAQATAEAERQRAEAENRVATSHELAAASLSNLNVDPERSILLALRAVATTYDVDKTVQPQAEDALHRAVITSARC
jgi:hypothetical protein